MVEAVQICRWDFRSAEFTAISTSVLAFARESEIPEPNSATEDGRLQAAPRLVGRGRIAAAVRGEQASET